MNEERVASLLQRSKINKLMYKYDDKFFSLISESWRKRNEIMASQDFYYYYNNIICSIVKLMKELKIEDPFMICQSFIYLLHSGFFSINGEYIYSVDDLIENSYCAGATVMTGKGKCLNNSDMLTDVLRKNRIASSLVSCKIGTFVISGHNHAITSFYDGDRIYFCDPTNDDFLYFCGFLKAKEIVNSEIFKIYIDNYPYVGNVSKEYFDMFINEPFRKHNTGIKTAGKILAMKIETADLLNSNGCLLGDFYDDIYDDIDNVCKRLVIKK